MLQLFARHFIEQPPSGSNKATQDVAVQYEDKSKEVSQHTKGDTKMFGADHDVRADS